MRSVAEYLGSAYCLLGDFRKCFGQLLELVPALLRQIVDPCPVCRTFYLGHHEASSSGLSPEILHSRTSLVELCRVAACSEHRMSITSTPCESDFPQPGFLSSHLDCHGVVMPA